MGAACSVDNEEKMSRRLSKDLEKDHKAAPKKLLLLGAGQAGKSTIFKQVKVIYTQGFDQKEREAYKGAILANVIEGIKTLVQEALSTDLAWTDQGQKAASSVMALSLSDTLTEEMGEMITYLWAKEDAIKNTFARRSTFQLGDQVPYMLNSVPRICAGNYVPTEEDVINTRVRTSGISEMKFIINDVWFLIMDVGGQRGERKKWIHCFDNVEAVLFVAAISEYDQVVQEDETTNRVTEAINLFRDICNLNTFLKTSIILFLNKSDIFEAKILNHVADLSVLFPTYTAGDNVEKAIDFLVDRFLEVQREDIDREIYCHVTCATNKQNVSVIFEAVKDVVIKRSLQDNGLM
eukprot:c523_g1_i1.p1 GENE.c523_g1_i1~~c523_g1_i1.p1  ORF type:complete len:350 (+),score=73.84 c523_g1_i1:83-1132(+)